MAVLRPIGEVYVLPKTPSIWNVPAKDILQRFGLVVRVELLTKSRKQNMKSRIQGSITTINLIARNFWYNQLEVEVESKFDTGSDVSTIWTKIKFKKMIPLSHTDKKLKILNSFARGYNFQL